MKITHFGHACVLLEFQAGRRTRILVDPGSYSTGFASVEGIDAVVVTHAHADHLDMARLPSLLEHNPDAMMIVDTGSADALAKAQIEHRVGGVNEVLSVGDVGVDVLVGDHAVIHSALPNIPNNGYLFDGHTLHPGDAFVEVADPVEVLLVPIGGPWMKIGEAIDYVRKLSPRVVIPIHQAGLAPTHQELHYNLLRNLSPDNTEIAVLDHAVPFTV